MNKQQHAAAQAELHELLEDLARCVKRIKLLHESDPQGEAIATLWDATRLVAASASVEHARLLGMDVAASEQALRDKNWVPWRDLLADSSDSETVPPEADVVVIAPATPTLEPSLSLVMETDTHVFYLLPLKRDLLPGGAKRGES